MRIPGTIPQAYQFKRPPLCKGGIPRSGWGIVSTIILDNLQIGSMYQQSLSRHRYAWPTAPFTQGSLFCWRMRYSLCWGSLFMFVLYWKLLLT